MRFSIDNVRNIANLIRELSVGLTKLSFSDNFDGFETEITIPAASVLSIRNQLSYVPTKRIILRQDKEAVISDSSTPWDDNFLYLENHHATNSVILTVQFIR